MKKPELIDDGGGTATPESLAAVARWAKSLMPRFRVYRDDGARRRGFEELITAVRDGANHGVDRTKCTCWARDLLDDLEQHIEMPSTASPPGRR